MRRVALLPALLIATAFNSGAIAADIPTKAPAAAPVAAPTWAGFYGGLAVGYGWGTSEQTDFTIFGPFTSGEYNIGGAILGGTLGYNWQAGAAVFGVETDLSWAAIKGSTAGTGPFGPCIALHCESEIQALGTLRGRLGYAWGNWLPYIAGGLAYARLRGEEGPLGPLGGSGSKWVAGWTIGGGVETMITRNWSMKLEYLFVDLGKHAVWTNIVGVATPATESLDTTAHIVRLGLNYHFTTW